MFPKSTGLYINKVVKYFCNHCKLHDHRKLSSLQVDVNHAREEIGKDKVPEPFFDFDYYCNIANRDEVRNNVDKRKSSGNIDHVLELNSSLCNFTQNTEQYTKSRLKLLAELSNLPNRTHHAVIELDEPRIIKTVGSQREFRFKPKEFSDIASQMRGARTGNSNFTGHRSYFLFGQLAALETALINFSVEKLLSKGFQLVSVPDILDRHIIESCGMNTRGYRNQVYSLDEEIYGPDLCLSGTSEMALAGLYMGKVLSQADLPLRLAAVSRCYRAETSRTSNERGIFRVHQFTKVEMFGITEPNDSENLLEEFRNIEEETFEQLGLHFRVLDMPPCELGAQAYRKYDVEAWMPGRGLFGEVSSCSDCTDFQARRLAIRIQDSANPGDSTQRFAHTVNGTALAVPRTLLSIIENFQNKNFTVDIPPALQPFMGGSKLMTRNTLFPKILPYKSKSA